MRRQFFALWGEVQNGFPRVVAVFSTEDKAYAYMANHRNANRIGFDSESLLSGCEDAWVETYDEPLLDPE